MPGIRRGCDGVLPGADGASTRFEAAVEEVVEGGKTTLRDDIILHPDAVFLHKGRDGTSTPARVFHRPEEPGEKSTLEQKMQGNVTGPSAVYPLHGPLTQNLLGFK